MIHRIIALLIKLIPTKYQKPLLNIYFTNIKLDPLTFAYNRIGILNFQNEIVSGEKFLIEKVVTRYFSCKGYWTLFDVGANKGKYTERLSKVFYNSKIYTFEPNPKTFEMLYNKFNEKKNIILCPIGFSSESTAAEIITYNDELTSSHSSLYEDLFITFHKEHNSVKLKINLDTIDNFCELKKIDRINFLKVDTEGHELNVLLGASKMIKNNKIDIIQFEFGECDVFSRVFLKDFYEILGEYDLYRLNSNSLININDYNTTNEIFRFQNIVAINKLLKKYD